MSSFEKESMQTQRTDLSFHDYKLAIEIDENRHRDRNIN